MADETFLSWPFFEEQHRGYAAELSGWCEANSGALHAESGDVGQDCRQLARLLGDAGVFRNAVPAAYGGTSERVDVRTLCLARQTLAYHAGLADFVFAMQALGTGAMIAGFALSEADAGSDEEGASEVQKVVIARAAIAAHGGGPR